MYNKEAVTEDMDTYLLFFALFTFAGNFVTMTSMFWHVERNELRHMHRRRACRAMLKSLPTLVVRLMHFVLAFQLQKASFKYFAMANEKSSPGPGPGPGGPSSASVDREIQAFWNAGVSSINETGASELLRVKTKDQLRHDFEYVAAFYNNHGDNMAAPNFTHSFEERVEFRGRHDLCHGMWHFHAACVIMGMGLTIMLGTVNENYDDNVGPPPNIAKWEHIAMGIELLMAFVNAGLEAIPAHGSSVDTHLAVVLTFVVVFLPLMVYILLEILGLGCHPFARLALIRNAEKTAIFSAAAFRNGAVAATLQVDVGGEAHDDSGGVSYATPLPAPQPDAHVDGVGADKVPPGYGASVLNADTDDANGQFDQVGHLLSVAAADSNSECVAAGTSVTNPAFNETAFPSGPEPASPEPPGSAHLEGAALDLRGRAEADELGRDDGGGFGFGGAGRGLDQSDGSDADVDL